MKKLKLGVIGLALLLTSGAFAETAKFKSVFLLTECENDNTSYSDCRGPLFYSFNVSVDLDNKGMGSYETTVVSNRNTNFKLSLSVITKPNGDFQINARVRASIWSEQTKSFTIPIDRQIALLEVPSLKDMATTWIVLEKVQIEGTLSEHLTIGFASEKSPYAQTQDLLIKPTE